MSVLESGLSAGEFADDFSFFFRFGKFSGGPCCRRGGKVGAEFGDDRCVVWKTRRQIRWMDGLYVGEYELTRVNDFF